MTEGDATEESTVLSVQVGDIAPLGPDGEPSGFVKRPVHGLVRVGILNVEGDKQADLSVHGGPEKAVYGYAASRYAEWLADFPEHSERLYRGAFGENLTIAGMNEADICAGDVHAIGTVRLQVCQPRQPCFKFALQFEDKRMPRAMVKSGRSGWYYRVLEEGFLQAGDTVRLVDRPHPDLPFERLVEIVNGGQASQAELTIISRSTAVAGWLCEAAQQRVRAKAWRNAASQQS